MVMERYPDYGVISYAGAGTFNSIGVWSVGTLTTVGVICRIQPARSNLTVINAGIEIKCDWQIMAPLTDGLSSVSNGDNFRFFSKDHVVKQLYIYQKHTEILC